MTRDEAKEVLELMDIIEGQQQLIRILLDAYPAQTQTVKQEMLDRSDNIRQKTVNYKSRAAKILAAELEYHAHQAKNAG